MGRNSTESGQFLTTITALAAFPCEAVANLKFSGCQIAHQAQPADSPSRVAPQIHDQPPTAIECCDSAVDVLGYINSDRTWKHRDLQQANVVGEFPRVYRLGSRNGMLLRLWDRQLNI